MTSPLSVKRYHLQSIREGGSGTVPALANQVTGVSITGKLLIRKVWDGSPVFDASVVKYCEVSAFEPCTF